MLNGIDGAGPLSFAETCAREPIHQIGQIQAHGLLFAASEPDLRVCQVSANVESILGLAPDVIRENSLEPLLGARQFEMLRTHILATGDEVRAKPLRLLLGEDELKTNCVVHRHDGALISEFELVDGVHSLVAPLDLAAHLAGPFSRMRQAADTVSLCRAATDEIQKLSGFDRVMVYRFDADWNGEVIAETAQPGSGSYVGLRFPASDIPAQARRLFLMNPLRTIADTASAPVPIVPEIGPHSHRPLDLTLSFLRSASPIHIQYLKNMNVRSSMTVSIIIAQRLWGMIACHGMTARTVDCSIRAVCELIGGILGSQVELRLDNAALKSRLTSRKLLDDYMAGMDASAALRDEPPFDGSWLLNVLDADGFVARIDGTITYEGTSLPETSLIPIIRKLRTFASRGIASSNMLGALDRSAGSFATLVSGALYLGLSDGSGDYVLLLRRELVETVTWAGNPDKAVNADADGALRPRTSFAAWKESVRGRSRPWSDMELENARVVREQLMRLQSAKMLRRSQDRFGAVADG